MTKKLLSLLFLFFSFALFSQTLIPNANFEQFLVDQGIDTNGLTGDILNADAQAVTALNVTRNDITDFTGLEAFVNLVTLNAGTNQFPTLPLTTLTALEELIFNQNTVLSNLDLSSNINLRRFDARANGGTNAAPITTIDLSNNNLLEYIHIYNFRNLTNVIFPNTDTVEYIYLLQTAAGINVDFSGYDNLETLSLSVNFSNAIAINAILPNNQNALKSASFQGGNITNPDLSNFLALEFLSFQTSNLETLQLPATTSLKRIRISSHNINTINVQDASGLEHLDITNKNSPGPLNLDITNNLQLLSLNAQNNNLINLDVTQNTLLEDLNVSNNELPTIDISQNIALVDLNASRNLITTLDLSQNIALEDLNLTTNELPAIDVSDNILLEDLLLGQNELTTLDVTNNPELFRLNISENLFTTSGLDLTQNPRLDNLDASNNQIESLNISQNPRLGTLNLSNNLFTGTDIIDQYHTIWSNQGALNASDRLDVSFNQLSGRIPDFASLIVDRATNYFEFRFNDNNFEFGDFETEHAAYVSALTDTWSSSPFLPFWRDYDYAPQAKVNAIETPIRNAGDNITLTTTVRGEQNHYKWFKDGIEITDAPDSPELVLTDLDTCDEGVYYSEITSDLVPFENANPPGANGKNLLLIRNDITLTVNATKNCVTLANPIDGATNIPINTGIEWNDNPGACGYKITVTNVDTGTPIQYNGNPITNLDVGDITLFNFDSDLPANTEISVQITPYFDDGDFGSCTTESFTTNASAIATECTTLIDYPRNNDTNVPSDVASISWNPANAADGYKLTITSTSGVNNLPETNIGNTLSYSFGQAFQAGDIVEISIVPTNSTFGDANSCSTESFTIASETVTPTPPNCTTLLNPSNTDTEVPVDLAQISWNAVANATQYRISINGSTSDLNDVTDLMVTGTSHPFTNNFDNGETVTVTIVPMNGSVEPTTPCTTESFTIVSASPTPPNCTTLLNPSNLDTDVPIDLAEISWNAVANATQYRISINGSTSDLNDVTDLMVTGTSHPFTNDFDNGETVTVTIVPLNGTVGPTTPCTTESFTIVSASPTPPNCTTLLNPSNTDTEVPVDLAQISWNAVANATQYRISINGSTSDLNDVTDLMVTGTSHPFTNNFDNGETVTVTIIPLNGTVEPTTTCSAETFTIETAAPTITPACTSLTSPIGTDVAIGTTQMTWDAVTDATGYRISIAGTANNNVTDIEITGTSYDFNGPFVNGETATVTITPFNGTENATGCTQETFTVRNGRTDANKGNKYFKL